MYSADLRISETVWVDGLSFGYDVLGHRIEGVEPLVER